MYKALNDLYGRKRTGWSKDANATAAGKWTSERSWLVERGNERDRESKNFSC